MQLYNTMVQGFHLDYIFLNLAEGQLTRMRTFHPDYSYIDVSKDHHQSIRN